MNCPGANTLHMHKPVITFLFKVLWPGLRRYMITFAFKRSRSNRINVSYVRLGLAKSKNYFMQLMDSTWLIP